MPPSIHSCALWLPQPPKATTAAAATTFRLPGRSPSMPDAAVLPPPVRSGVPSDADNRRDSCHAPTNFNLPFGSGLASSSSSPLLPSLQNSSSLVAMVGRTFSRVEVFNSCIFSLSHLWQLLSPSSLSSKYFNLKKFKGSQSRLV